MSTLAERSGTTAEVGHGQPVRRGLWEQDWRRLLKVGSVGALAQVFIALSGMPLTFDGRTLIDPILSLGYLSLVWLPVVLGYVVGRERVLAGVQAYAKGGRDVLAGALVGAVGGSGLSLLVLMLTHLDLRDPLVNWGPPLLELLEFEQATAFGMLVWVGIGAATGAAGGGLHWLPQRLRRTAVAVVLTVLGVAVLESVLTDLSEDIGLEAVTDWLYAPQRGLTGAGTAGVAVLAATATLTARGRIKTLRSKASELEGQRRSVVHLAGLLAIVAVAIVLPLFLGKITNELLANVGLFVLLALGLNIIVGLAGILDLGYVAFFAVGGYSVAVLTSPGSPRVAPELPWGVALLIAMLLAGLVGLFIGAPVIRMRGDYLAIVTLGFGEIIRLLLLSDWLSGWFGGAQGITNIPGVEVFGLATVHGFEPRSVLYLVMFFCAIAIYVSWRLERSRIGRAWMAIREDETVAEAIGIDTVSAKLMAFVTGAVLGSFSGAIFSAKVGVIFPSSFLIIVSIVILVVVIFGGMGNIAGVIAGAAVLIGVLGGPRQPGLLQEFSQYKILIYGALLVWMMLQRPEGLLPNVRRARELHVDDISQDAWLRSRTQDEPTGATGGGSEAHGEQP